MKGCRKESNREKDLVGIVWELVVRLMQVMFRDVMFPVDIAWAKMVFFPKGKV